MKVEVGVEVTNDTVSLFIFIFSATVGKQHDQFSNMYIMCTPNIRHNVAVYTKHSTNHLNSV